MIKVLHVDDSRDDLEVIGSRLNRVSDDLHIKGIESAPQALELLEKGNYECVLCDYQMPGIDGLQLLKTLRQRGNTIPFIFLTGQGNEEVAAEALRAGASDYYTKGVGLALYERLVNSIRRVVEVRDRRLKHQEAVEALRESEASLAEAQHIAKLGNWVWEIERNELSWSDEIYRIFGVAPQEFEATYEAFLGYVHPDDREFVIKTVDQALYEKKPYGIDHRIVLPDGSEHIVHEEGAVTFNEAGEPVRMLGTVQDITEWKQFENELRVAHEETEQLLASMSSILIAIDDKSRITKWNAAAERTFGIASTDVVGRPLDECGIQWDGSEVYKALSSCKSNAHVKRLDDLRFKRPDGKDGFLGITLQPVSGDTGELWGCLLMAADITERKILESQLAQAQKLEVIGQLAAGIAHEINTPTQYIGDNTRFLQDAFSDLSTLLERYAELSEACATGAPTTDLIQKAKSASEEVDLAYLKEEIPKSIEETLEGIERVSKIVLSMKDFSHPGIDEKTAIDLKRAIESTITIARSEWKYVAEMVTDFDPDLPMVPCLPNEFNQVILNVIINAAQAIADVVGDGTKGKGTITVSTRRRDEWAEIRISDTGTGIPKGIRSKIFDPFFTTKDVGTGTGQGLALACAIVVEKHGGSLTFDTEVGKGTTFIIRLPINPDHS